jgi:hypothetical protein
MTDATAIHGHYRFGKRIEGKFRNRTADKARFGNETGTLPEGFSALQAAAGFYGKPRRVLVGNITWREASGESPRPCRCGVRSL